jgi:hypothetical protein
LKRDALIAAHPGNIGHAGPSDRDRFLGDGIQREL